MRRRVRQPIQDVDILPMRKGHGGSVHIWGAIHYGGKSGLKVLEGNVSGALYKQPMADVVLPYVRGAFDENFVWQHDNALDQKSRLMIDYLDREDVTVLPWSACYPDCNPIEN